MSWPSFLQGIIDRFKRGEGDSDDDIQAKETEQGQRVGACTGSAVSSGVNNIGNNILLNLGVDPGKRDINSVDGVAVCYDTGQMTTYPLIMSQTFFTNVMGELKALDPPICQERVTGASGVELIPLGCFRVRVSFPLLMDFPPVELTCCVYSNLTSDILMGSAYLKCVSLSNPLTVSQFPSGYVFNSTSYSQPSLTSREAHECNMMLARHVYSAKPGTTGNHYSNPGLKQILEKWEAEGRALPQKPPSLRVQGVATDKYGGIHPQAPSLNAKGWPCQESLVGPSQNSVFFRIKNKTIIKPGTTQKVQVYYPTASRDPSRFQYFLEGTDKWGNPWPEADQDVGCAVLDGVLPLQQHQQGYGGTQTVYLVNNTQDKQVYFQHEIIARGTVIMNAEGEMGEIYEQTFPPPQQVNGVRQGQVQRRQPPKKGTPWHPTHS